MHLFSSLVYYIGKWFRTCMQDNFWCHVTRCQTPSMFGCHASPEPEDDDVRHDDASEQIAGNYWSPDPINALNNKRIRKCANQAHLIKSQLVTLDRQRHKPKLFDQHDLIVAHHGVAGTGKTTRMVMQASTFHSNQCIQVDHKAERKRCRR